MYMFDEIHIFILGTKKSGSRFSTNLFEPCARNVLCLDKRENGNVMNSKRDYSVGCPIFTLFLN